MARKKATYAPIVSAETADTLPNEMNGWSEGYTNISRMMHGGNGTLASYRKGSESIELGRSDSDYYVLLVGETDETSLGWSADITEMIRLLASKLAATHNESAAD